MRIDAEGKVIFADLDRCEAIYLLRKLLGWRDSDDADEPMAAILADGEKATIMLTISQRPSLPSAEATPTAPEASPMSSPASTLAPRTTRASRSR